MHDRSHSQRRNLQVCNSLVLTMVLPMLAETLHVAHGHPIGQSSFGIQQAGLKVSKQEQKCWNEGEEPFSTFFVCLFCLRGLSLKKNNNNNNSSLGAVHRFLTRNCVYHDGFTAWYLSANSVPQPKVSPHSTRTGVILHVVCSWKQICCPCILLSLSFFFF